MTKHIVTIEGDNKGLRRSTNEAADLLDSLSEKASGIDFGGGLSGLTGSLRGSLALLVWLLVVSA